MKYQIPSISKLLTCTCTSIRIYVQYFDYSETGQHSLFNSNMQIDLYRDLTNAKKKLIQGF